jgi:hypothetical protein
MDSVQRKTVDSVLQYRVNKYCISGICENYFICIMRIKQEVLGRTYDAKCVASAFGIRSHWVLWAFNFGKACSCQLQD